MKRVFYIIYIFCLCISWSSLSAREYHVSVQGNDNNSGTLIKQLGLLILVT